jgi:hypothetical protein
MHVDMPVNAYIVNFPTSTGSHFDGMHFHAGFRYESEVQINELQTDGGLLKFWKQYTSKQDMQDSESQTLTFKDVRALLLTKEKKIKVIYNGNMSGAGAGLTEPYYLEYAGIEMNATYLFTVRDRRWADFVVALEAWATRNNIAVLNFTDGR